MKYKVFEPSEDNSQRRLNFHKKKSIRAISNGYLATSNTTKDCSRGEIFLFGGKKDWQLDMMHPDFGQATTVGTNEKHILYSEGAYNPPEEKKQFSINSPCVPLQCPASLELKLRLMTSFNRWSVTKQNGSAHFSSMALQSSNPGGPVLKWQSHKMEPAWIPKPLLRRELPWRATETTALSVREINFDLLKPLRFGGCSLP